MKKTIQLFILFVFALGGMQQQSFACGTPILDVDITGPSGRCAVESGVATTYTGSHNFPSTGCTIYEWTISGGTIAAPSGASVSNGLLCIMESLACFPSLSIDCEYNEVDITVASGNGSSVTVIWDEDVVGTLKLKVREVGSKTLSDKTSIEVDNETSTLTSIFIASRTQTSGTYLALFDKVPCENAVVRWSINGNNAGTGNPKTLPVGTCTNAVICANAEPVADGEVCRTFSLDTNISGSSSATVGSEISFFIGSDYQMTSIQWSAQPASAVSFYNPTNGQNVAGIVQNTNTSVIFVCANVTTSCGNTFERCKMVFISSGINGESTPDPKHNQGIELRDAVAQTNGLEELNFKLYPTLIDQQQDLNLELPILEQAAAVSILSIQGKLIKQYTVSDQLSQISTGKLPSGLYIVQVRSGQWMASEKFVVR